MSERTAAEERAAIVVHIHNVGDAMARIGREHDARSMHILALAIESGAHAGQTRQEMVATIGDTLRTLSPEGKS